VTTTLFTWGYYGWGNHTPDLVEAVDAVETSRGFRPPFFVDIRIKRAVRASGFQGPAFERLLGQDRHRWMKSLGNTTIVTRTGPRIQIADPSAAAELLGLALELAREEQRLLFFCSCQWPKCDGEIACHRATVAALVLEEAKKRGVRIKVEEWPGGGPDRIDYELPPKDFTAVKKGRLTVPLGQKIDLAKLAALPWCSTATLHSGCETLHRVVGPAICQASGWVLPVLYQADESDNELKGCESESLKLRSQWGLGASSSF
jgi:hypothetical protein